MTRKEAIKKLEHYRYCLKFQYGWYSKDDDEALDMAIKALQKDPCEDCVSRQAVIEITAETGALETQAKVKALPSVTPQPR